MTEQKAKDAIEQISELIPGTAPVAERVRQMVQLSSFKGPIPSPEIFAKYGEVVPGSPERILKVFEEDSRHARDIQMAALQAQRDDNQRVHWMAYSLIVGGLVLAFVFSTMNKDWLAGIILGTTLVGSITGLQQTRRVAEPPKASDDAAPPPAKK